MTELMKDVSRLFACGVRFARNPCSVLQPVCSFSAISIVYIFGERAQCCHLFSSTVSVQNKYFCTRIAYRNDKTKPGEFFSQPYAVSNVQTCMEMVARDILNVPCF